VTYPEVPDNSLELEPIAKRAWVVLIVCTSTVFLMLLDSGGMFIAFPFIEERFTGEATRTTLSWVVTVFYIVMVSVLLAAGRLSDRWGRRRTFLAGLTIYAVAAFIGSTATTVWLLILMRAIQGIGVALLAPSALALCLPEFPHSRRAYALGVWATIGAAAGMLASPLAAILLALFSWRAVFVFNGLVALFTCFVGFKVLDDQTSKGNRDPIDFVAATLATIAVAGLALVLVQGNVWGWSDPKTMLSGVTTIILAPILLFRNRRQAFPLFDPEIFGNKHFAIASVSSTCCQIGFFSLYFGLPLYMKEVWGWGPLKIGMGLLPINIVPLFAAVAVGKLVDKEGPRRAMAWGGIQAGIIYLVIGFWLMDAGYLYFAIGISICGFGAMAISNTTTVAALFSIKSTVLSSANAGYYLTRRLGSAFGAVATAAIIGNRIGDDFSDIYLWVWVLGGTAYILGGVVALLFYPNTVGLSEEKSQ
jgi:MFS family permease